MLLWCWVLSAHYIGLTTLERRRARGDLVECFKIVNGFSDYGNREFFTFARERHAVNTRSAAEGLLVPQKTTLEIRKKFFSIRVVNAWNELPIEIRTASSVNSFKNLYDLFSNDDLMIANWTLVFFHMTSILNFSVSYLELYFLLLHFWIPNIFLLLHF